MKSKNDRQKKILYRDKTLKYLVKLVNTTAEYRYGYINRMAEV